MSRASFRVLPLAFSLFAGSWTLLLAQAPPGYTLLFQDNFDGTHVNEQDWAYRVDRRQMGTWVNGLDRAENVSEHDGALHITVRKEKIDGKDEFTGGGLISKHQFGYGYYECLSRPFMAGKGAHTAFWQSGGAVPNNEIFEIDSYEIDSGDFMGTNNLYMHLRPPDGKLAARRRGLKTNTNDGATVGKIGYTGDEYTAVGDIALRSGAAEPPDFKSEHFAGDISDLRIYNRALSEAETTGMTTR